MSVDKDLVSVHRREIWSKLRTAHSRSCTFEQARIIASVKPWPAGAHESARLGALAVGGNRLRVAADKQEKNRFAAEDV